MKVKLIRADETDCNTLWKMQVEAFSELYEKYRDDETSPAAEPPEKTLERLRQPFTYFYFIEACGETVGAVRVVDKKDEALPKRISPIFVMKRFRNMGIAQAAISEAERLHGATGWELEAIREEPAAHRVYEKLGYKSTGETKQVNGKMSLMLYKK